nr:type ISP restriction/modification enzyme [Staphylococcus aureus]
MNALRSTDERFNAIVNQLQLNKEKSGNIDIINPGKGRPRKPYKEGEENGNLDVNKPIQQELELWDDIKEAIYGKIVRKVGNRRYLEDWSKDVNEIAQRYIRWITDRINDKENPIKNEFSKFVYSLQINLNKSITIELAIEMLAQHLITKPVFEALFDQNSFVNNNPVSQSMEKVVKELQKAGFEKEQDRLKPFYESVKLRASGIDNAESKQKLITTLYEKFFSTGFKTTSKRLGIIFTPVEVVDFIIKSVDEILQNHFEKSLSSKGVHILDPFTGTGTFVARVLSYLKSQMEQNKISMADIVHKYTKELHANEIILLSYYIAAINIETTFNEIDTNLEYQPFEGIVLTDTFESTENDNTFDDIFFGINNKRLKQQKKLPITAIIGNPPYKKIKATANDFTAVQNYPMLDGKINETYARETSANLKNSLQDSYIRALRWSTDRIGDTGIIGFITNNGYIDSASLNGVRKVLEKDFNYIYVINLKGSLSGLSSEAIKREGKNIFDIKTGVAIIILVKDGSNAHSIKYYDIGNNLSKQEKLDILSNNSIKDLDFIDIIPDENGDWINHRDKNYGKYLALGGEKDAVFQNKLVGFNTNRDFWSFNFSKKEVEKNIERMISNYNTEIEKSNDYDTQEEKLKNLNSNESYIKWSQGLKDKFIKSEKLNFKPNKIILTQAKPFTKKYVYYDRDLVERPGKFDSVLEENGEVIYTPGPGGARTFSALVGKGPINLQAFGYASKTQTYPIKVKTQGFEEDNFSNVTEKAKARFGLNDEEVIYYIYAVMHHQSFITRYEDDLRKIIPRIPLLKNVKKFVNIGKKLLDLHLNYEAVAPCENVKIKIKSENPDYTVKK